jgi:putative flippase GtrA
MIYRQALRYGAVGLSGLIINLIFFYMGKEYFKVGNNSSSIFAFMIAVTSNYTLNRIWTFNNYNNKRIEYKVGLIQYIAANLMGLGVTLAVLNLTTFYAGEKFSLVGQVFGIFCGMLCNFCLSKFLIFNEI